MKNRIEAKFAQLKMEGRIGFIAYICAGDPTLPKSLEIALALEHAGVDILEVGLPFSDPLADGIVNQLAAQRALEAGATVDGVLEMIESLREQSEIPIVLYTYLNPVYQHGFREFHEAAAAAGVDGILILDLPPDEAAQNADLREATGLCHIQLVAPTTPPDRIPTIVAPGKGFIYYVSREGVTGEQSSVSATIGSGVAEIRKHTSLPVAVGFGISTPDHVREVAAHADAVVVGSAIVRQIAEHGHDPDVAAKVAGFVRPLAQATRKG